MSILKQVLKAISDYPGGYGAIYEMVYNENTKGNKSKEQVLRTTLSRMKKMGLLSSKKRVWKITKEGEELLRQKKIKFVKFPKEIGRDVNKTMIVVFDIPEKKRIYRDWLRNELIGFGYELIQKSVWFGPSLPKEFIKYLNEKKILKYIKFFKATESDII